MSALIHLRQVRCQRGGFTLDIPELTISPGEVVGLVGANGAGKTTLLRLLPGLDAPDSGSVQVLGKDPIRQTAAVRSVLAFMSDDQPLFAVRIGQLLDILAGYYPTWDGDLVDTLLSRFRLDRTAQIARLSKGEGTRLRLVAALAFRPQIVVLDEPGTGLDLGGRQALLKTVLEIVQDPGRAVIISSHSLADVERVADRLVVMKAGGIFKDGLTPDLISDDVSLEEQLIAWGAAG